MIDADEIIVLKQGEIVERGSHRTLVSAKGLYQQMWMNQQEEKDQLEA